MKKIVFAHIACLYDFDSEQEATAFQDEAKSKGWYVNKEVYKADETNAKIKN